MPTDPPADWLAALGYTEPWLRLGVIDAALVRAQHLACTTSDDRSPEHYRHRAFAAFVARAERWSDEDLRALLMLRDAGQDGVDLSAQRAIALVESRAITTAQLDALASHEPRVLTAPIERRYRRACLRRAIAARGVAACAERIRAEADGHVQRELLDRPDLDVELLRWLRHHGANRAIRNRARQRLERRRMV